MKIFYFTATGNSLAVAKKIGGELISIPQVKLEENQVYKDDVIGVIFPTYGCNVPKYVKSFLENVKFEAEYTFAIGTYGMGKGNTMEIAQAIAKTHGYSFDYLNMVLMLDNCQPQFDISKEIKKLPAKNVDEQIDQIIKDIENRKTQLFKTGFGDKIGTWLCEYVLTIENEDFAKKYYIDENCNLCGTCTKVCPIGNVSISTCIEFASQCVCCQACIHACPKQAIHLKRERSSVRWRNQNVTLKEIIKANNQNKSE